MDYYKKLIYNDRNTKLSKKQEEIINKALNKLDTNSFSFLNILAYITREHITETEDIFGIKYNEKFGVSEHCFEIFLSLVYGLKKEERAKKEELDYLFTKSDKVLKILFSQNKQVFKWFIESFFASGISANFEDDLIKKLFPFECLPLFRMLDYALENEKYINFYLLMEPFSKTWASNLYYEVSKDKIRKIFNNDMKSDSFLVLAFLEKEKFFDYFPYEEKKLFKNCTTKIYNILIENDVLPKDIILNDYFLENYKNLNINEQIEIVSLLINNEYPKEFTDKLIELYNKKINSHNFEILTEDSNFESCSYELILKWKQEIINSSLYKKGEIKSDPLLIEILNSDNLFKKFDKDYFSILYSYYLKCRNYSTESIVNSLYKLNELNSDVVEMKETKFNILARVKTDFDAKDLFESFEKRTFCGYSILCENNFSHYGDEPLFGYYSNITPNLISHVFPKDSLSKSYARYEKNLSKWNSMWLDIDDLNRKTYNNRTYNQLCIRTKDNEGKILLPDCIVSTNEKYRDRDISVAKEYGIKTLVLNKNKFTIEENKDIFRHLK